MRNSKDIERLLFEICQGITNEIGGTIRYDLCEERIDYIITWTGFIEKSLNDNLSRKIKVRFQKLVSRYELQMVVGPSIIGHSFIRQVEIGLAKMKRGENVGENQARN